VKRTPHAENLCLQHSLASLQVASRTDAEKLFISNIAWAFAGPSGILKNCCHTQKIEQEPIPMPKRTFQPNRRHRAKTHGFLSRMKTKAGAAVLSRRRAKGRHKIAVSAGYRD